MRLRRAESEVPDGLPPSSRRAPATPSPAGPLLPNKATAVCFKSGALRAVLFPRLRPARGVTPERRRAMAENIISLSTPFGAFTGTTVSRVHASVSGLGNVNLLGHDTDHRERLTVERTI